MRRNLFIIVVTFLVIIALMVTGDVITIGEKLSQMTNCIYVEYSFYGILVLLLTYFILLPIYKVHKAPAMPNLSIDNELSDAELAKFAKKLTNSCSYISEMTIREKHKAEFAVAVRQYSNNREALKQVLQDELNARLEGSEKLGVIGIDQRIVEWAKSVFMITAVSQNSKFDTLSVMYMNYKMIEDIILASGFRPNNAQLFKLYAGILTTSLITYSLSEAFGAQSGSVAPFDFGDIDADDSDITNTDVDIDTDAALDGDLAEQMSDHDGFSLYSVLRRIKIPSVVVGSIIDGTLNALMTLRIGYVTKTYLQKGVTQIHGIQDKRLIKRQAMRSAVVAIPTVVASGSTVLGKKATNLVIKIIKRAK